jgi:hypothetical protein
MFKEIANGIENVCREQDIIKKILHFWKVISYI